jgi:flagellar assembly protein FliH
MNSSSEAQRVTGALTTPELRAGTWTRFGADSVLGDAVTERTLSALAESTRSAARSQGYAVGWSEGQRAARAEAAETARLVDAERRAEDAVRAAEHRDALDALRSAAARLHDAVGTAVARVDEHASALTLALTETILGFAAADLDTVRRGLSLAPPDGLVALRVHPDDVVPCEVRLIADPGLARGDVLAEYDDHVLDLRISTALERVREALGTRVPR